MAGGLFGADICAAILLAACLLYRYGDVYRQPVLVTFGVLVAWSFSFLIIFILPLDVSSTVFRTCNITEGNTTWPSAAEPTTGGHHNITTAGNINTAGNNTSGQPDGDHEETTTCSPPPSYLPPEVLYGLWRVVYWSSQVLTWLLLPMMQSFTQAGEFTFLGKLKSSLWDNAIYYCSYLLIATILLIYIALKPDLHLDFQKLKAIAAAASNTWGLTLLVFMMGYGLVEVPSQLWHSSKRGYRLNQAYFKVSKLWGERSDAEGELEDVLSRVEALRQSDSAGPVRDLIDIIQGKVPPELLERVRRRRVQVEAGVLPDERMLAKLHKQVNVRLQSHRRTEAQWSELISRVFWLEDQHRNSLSNERIYKHQLPDQEVGGWLRLVYSPVVEWYSQCLLLPLLYKVAALVACIMSAMLTWSEVTFFNKSPPLSLFAVFIQAASYNRNYAAIEIISFLTILYMCTCAYYTIFKVRVLNYYYLASHHQSDPYTLLFSGALLCRLTPPLCLNFLSLVHMDSHVLGEDRPETSYTRVMGHMDVVSIISDYFNIYFPILLIILTLATYFSLGSRFLSSLGFQQFLVSDETSVELVEEGRELVRREKRRRDRVRGGRSSAREADPQQQQEEVRPGAGPDTPSHPLSSTRQFQNYSSRGRDEMEVTAREPPRNLFDDI